MKNYTIEAKDIDIEELHNTIKAELGDKFSGISVFEGGVTIHLMDEVTASDYNKALTHYHTHDVSKLPKKEKPKTLEERLLEMEAEITKLKTEKAEAQSGKR